MICIQFIMMTIIIMIGLVLMDIQLRRRLAIVDMYLYYWGRVQRKDLSYHFDIGSVTASRVLKAYSELYPENIEFSVRDRSYVLSDAFKCAYESDPGIALMLLGYGIESRPIAKSYYGPSRVAAFSAPLIPEFVSAITRAMVAAKGVGICYVSGSGENVRTVYPHSIFQGGAAWYFRAYDNRQKDFRTFRFSRIVGLAETVKVIKEFNKKNDIEWNTQVILTLAPHERHVARATLAIDLGLKGLPVKNISVNKAIAGFVLTDLRVDCSVSGNLDPNEFPLQLQNRSEILDVESMLLAPGFKE